MQQLNFFNTTSLSPVELAAEVANADRQEQRILQIMEQGKYFTPCEVHRYYCRMYPGCPLTSIRRSFTVLTSQGLLQKTDSMVTGAYGKRVHCWVKL